MNLPLNIIDWFEKRGVTQQVLSDFNISWDGNRIVYPIYDSAGNFLFNKYRRSPFTEVGPKYMYDKSAKATLYGLHKLNDAKYVICCEGENDLLALWSKGIPAVTSTGGAGTFADEWAELLSGIKVTICYDFDDAGIKGSFNTHSIIDGSVIAWLPKEVGEHGDITDFFTKLKKTSEDFMALSVRSYKNPVEWRTSKTKKELELVKKEYEMQMETLLIIARDMRAKYQSDRHIQILLNDYMNRFNEVKRAIKYWKPSVERVGSDRLAAAKAVPIPRYINFNSSGFAKCLWHDDKHPSMHYYPKQNRVKCFSCDKLGDVIDVIQEMRKVGIKDAINIILNHG